MHFNIKYYTRTDYTDHTSRVGYCWWGCCVFTVMAVVIFSGFPMFIGSVLIESKLTEEFFAIANDYNEVVCFGCIFTFTLTIIILLIITIVMMFVILFFCKYGDRPSKSGAAFSCFCVVLLAAGLILIICQPVWLASNMNIVKNYEESSKITFKKQLNNKTIQITWDHYQERFKCCGYRNYSDYQKLYQNHTLPISCCNTTTLPNVSDCLVAVENVTDKEVNASEIYVEGCPQAIVHYLNLDSTSVLSIGIASAVFSGFFFIAPIAMILLTFLLMAKNKEDAETIGFGLLIGIFGVFYVCKLISICKN